MEKNLSNSRLLHLLLLCCFVGVAIYGMSTASLTVGLFLLASGCVLYALEKGHVDTEDLKTPERTFF